MKVNMEAVAHHYKRNFRERSEAELRSFAAEPSLSSAVCRAGLSEDPRGRRYSHQRRRKDEALLSAKIRLTARLADLEAASDFTGLHEVASSSVKNIDDIGELYIYDTALHIGARRGLEPTRIYLHSGTREGAKALGLEWKRKCLDLCDFPELREHLEAHEIEDVLCIYKRYFAGERELAEPDACWSDDDLRGC